MVKFYMDVAISMPLPSLKVYPATWSSSSYSGMYVHKENVK